MLACLKSSPAEALLCMCLNSLYLLFFSVYKREDRDIGLLIQFSVQQFVFRCFPVEDFYFQK